MGTVANLLRHAERFGCEGVLEAGVDLDLPREQLIELLAGLDAIAARDNWTPRRRLTPETRVRRILGEPEPEPAR
jgi:hypothetical protein